MFCPAWKIDSTWSCDDFRLVIESTMPNYTLVLITNRLIARIDVRVRVKVNIDSFQTAERPKNVSIGKLIETVLEMGPKKTHPVWLYSSDFWTGSIRIPSDLYGIANADELNQAAILEAETQSGIPAFQSKVAMSQIENDSFGDPQFWVTQIQEDLLNGIQQAFRSSEVKWLGIAHPALTCPDPLSDSQRSLEGLESELGIRTWARDIAMVCSAQVPSTPCFAVPVKLMTQQSQTIWAATALLLTVAACAYASIQDKNTLKQIEQKSLSHLDQKEMAESLNRALQTAESSLDEKRKKVQADTIRLNTLSKELELIRFNQSTLHGHCSNLMDAIANSADSDSWLQSIESNASRTTLKGLSLSEASAHRFASGLELQPKLAGHTVSPAQIRQLESDLIEFSIEIELFDATTSPIASQEITP